MWRQEDQRLDRIAAGKPESWYGHTGDQSAKEDLFPEARKRVLTTVRPPRDCPMTTLGLSKAPDGTAKHAA